MVHEVPRVVFAAIAQDDDEGLVVAIAPGDRVVFQIATTDARLREWSAEHPPTVTTNADAAVELCRELLRQLRPDLAKALRSGERGRLRAVDGPEVA